MFNGINSDKFNKRDQAILHNTLATYMENNGIVNPEIGMRRFLQTDPGALNALLRNSNPNAPYLSKEDVSTMMNDWSALKTEEWLAQTSQYTDTQPFTRAPGQQTVKRLPVPEPLHYIRKRQFSDTTLGSDVIPKASISKAPLPETNATPKRRLPLPISKAPLPETNNAFSAPTPTTAAVTRPSKVGELVHEVEFGAIAGGGIAGLLATDSILNATRNTVMDQRQSAGIQRAAQQPAQPQVGGANLLQTTEPLPQATLTPPQSQAPQQQFISGRSPQEAPLPKTFVTAPIPPTPTQSQATQSQGGGAIIIPEATRQPNQPNFAPYPAASVQPNNPNNQAATYTVATGREQTVDLTTQPKHNNILLKSKLNIPVRS